MRNLLLCLAFLSFLSCSLEGDRRDVSILSVGMTYRETDARSLHGTENDAREIALALEARWEAPGKEVLIDPSKEEVLSALSSLPPSDLTIFFYSGHGTEDGSLVFSPPEGESYWTEDGIRPDALLSPGVLTEKLLARKGDVLLLVDACHSGTFVPEDGSDAFSPGCLSLPSLFQAFDPWEGKEDRLWVIAATSPEGVGRECRTERHAHGVFTEALLRALGWDDETGTCIVRDATADSLYRSVLETQKMPLSGLRSQRPRASGGACDLRLWGFMKGTPGDHMRFGKEGFQAKGNS